MINYQFVGFSRFTLKWERTLLMISYQYIAFCVAFRRK